MTKSLKLKLNILYFFIFGSLAGYSPFLTPYFQDRGLSFSQIGIIFAVNSLVSIIAQPLWGAFTDKYANKKTTLNITMILSGFFAFGFVAAKGFYIILLAVLMFIIFQSPIISVNDAYCYDILDEHREIQYGRIRLMGSIGFAVTALLLGAAIKFTSLNLPFIVYFIYIIISMFILGRIDVKTKRTGIPIDTSDIMEVLKNKRFILLTLSALVANAAIGANNSYISILIGKTGGDISNLGMLWFIIAMSELPAFFFGQKIMKKLGVLNVYLIGIAFYAVRFLSDSISLSYTTVLAAQFLQGITFTLYLMTTLQYISHIVQPQTRTTAMTVFTAAAGGIGGFLGNIGGGFLLQLTSVFNLFKIMAGLCMASLLIGLLLKRIDRKSI